MWNRGDLGSRPGGGIRQHADARECSAQAPGWKAPSRTSGPIFSMHVAVRKSIVDQSGRLMPNPANNVVKYSDQLTATATFPIAYSRIRSHPMIQAMNSPRVA